RCTTKIGPFVLPFFEPKGSEVSFGSRLRLYSESFCVATPCEALRFEGVSCCFCAGRVFQPGSSRQGVTSKGYSCASKGFSTQRGVDCSGRFSGPKSFSGRGKRLWMLWRGDTRTRLEPTGTLAKLPSFHRASLLTQA